MEKITAKGWLKICSFFFLLSLPVFLGGCGSSSTSEPAFNIAGSWFIYDATNSIAGEQGPNIFNFTTSDTTIGGTTSQGQVITGTTSDVNVSFSWVGSDGAKYTYDGKVGNNGETMSGTWSNASGQNGTWLGSIDVAPSVTIPGSWVITTSGSQGTIAATFTQSGNGITITTQQGQQSPPGTISYLNLVFFALGSDGATYTYTGTVNSSADSMSGTWTNTNGQSGTWSATKG